MTAFLLAVVAVYVVLGLLVLGWYLREVLRDARRPAEPPDASRGMRADWP